MGRLTKPTAMARMNLATSQETRDKVGYLLQATGADTLTEVVRRAIDVYGRLIEEQAAGNTIHIQRKNKTVELMLT